MRRRDQRRRRRGVRHRRATLAERLETRHHRAEHRQQPRLLGHNRRARLPRHLPRYRGVQLLPAHAHARVLPDERQQLQSHDGLPTALRQQRRDRLLNGRADGAAPVRIGLTRRPVRLTHPTRRHSYTRPARTAGGGGARRRHSGR